MWVHDMDVGGEERACFFARMALYLVQYHTRRFPMSPLASLQRQCQSVLDEIARLPPMRPGTLRRFSPGRRRQDGLLVRRGPYWNYTFKRSGKTLGRHIGEEALADAYRQQIEAFRRFRQLSRRFVEMSQRMADLAVEKKGFARRSET